MKNLIRWAVGAFLLLSAVVEISKGGYLSALLLCLAGLITLPPILPLLEHRFNLKLTRELRYISVGVLFLAGVFLSPKGKDDGNAVAQEATSATSAQTTVPPFDLHDLEREGPAYLEKRYGPSTGTEKFDHKSPCEGTICDKFFYANGGVEAIFEDSTLVSLTVFDSSQTDFNKEALSIIGLAPQPPDFGNDSSMRWYFYEGFEVSIFDDGAGKVHYVYVKKASEKDLAERERKQKITAQFSEWDGSHKNLTMAIKANMNDEDSYEHVETRYEDKGKYIIVYTKFRGSNAFGAKVLQTIGAKIDIDGNLIELLKD